MNSLKNRVAIITGAGKGLGRAVAVAFAKEGASLALFSRSQTDLESLQKEVGGAAVLCVHGDAADEKIIQPGLDQTLKRFGRLDCLVNNAGTLTARARVPDITVADWDETMRVNLRGPFLWMKHAIPIFLKQRSGSVINVSSGAGKREAPEWGPYAVSKFGIEGLTLAAAAELSGTGVRVNAVNPGGTRTRMRAAAYPKEDPLTLPAPEDVAPLFVWLASDESASINGQSVDFREWNQRA
jgi:NAD(P)-dependent dehydrogenase (short-subunit alcohol dehydrogenase family)